MTRETIKQFEWTKFVLITTIFIFLRHDPTTFKILIEWLVEDLKTRRSDNWLARIWIQTSKKTENKNWKQMKRRKWKWRITASSASSEARRSWKEEAAIKRSTAKIPRGIRFCSPMFHCNCETLTRREITNFYKVFKSQCC